MKTIKHNMATTVLIASSLILTACENTDDKNPDNKDDKTYKTFAPYIGSDLNRKTAALLSLNPGGVGGSPNQSLRAGDVLTAQYNKDSILIGGLGVDVLIGDSGDDILIGGTEDFNSSVDGDNKGADNRDRAFGNQGDDVFIWAPGDGSDFFDGGEGTDVIVFGVIGEKRDSNGSTEGAPFFNVNPPTKAGSQDFDGIFLDAYYQPTVKVSNSPGFCSVIDKAQEQAALDALDIDQIIRFSLRGIANQFDAKTQTEDDGLRVAVSTKNVEYLVCTKRDITEDGGVDNIQVLDLTTQPPSTAALSDLPQYVQGLLK